MFSVFMQRCDAVSTEFCCCARGLKEKLSSRLTGISGKRMSTKADPFLLAEPGECRLGIRQGLLCALGSFRSEMPKLKARGRSGPAELFRANRPPSC